MVAIMVTFYAKCSDGSLTEVTMNDMDGVNYALLTLYWGMDEQGLTFEFITKSEYERLSKNPVLTSQKAFLSLENKVLGRFYEYYQQNSCS
jgi:hypothetical protein